jgi:hypothetical protein
MPINKSARRIAIAFALSAVAMPVLALSPLAQSLPVDFYDVALCKPPFGSKTMADSFHAAESLGKADRRIWNATTFHSATPLGKDGFSSDSVVFTNFSVGVLIDGEKATELAKRYDLQLEKPDSLLRANIAIGYAAKLAEQPDPALGTVSIVARETPMFPGKTWLACEMLWHEDAERAAQMHKLMGH